MRPSSSLPALLKIGLFGALAAFAFRGAHAQAPHPGLIAAYSFNEGQGTSAADASGNGLAGAVSNATWTTGRFGGALQFTGQSTSRVSVPPSALLGLDAAFTLSAWVNPQAGQPSEPTVIAKEMPGGLPYVLYAQGGGAGPNAYTFIGGAYESATAPSRIPANAWTHLAAAYDGTTLSIYVDGVLASSSPISGGLAQGNGALRIGNNAVFSNEGFIGRIDEVRVYNRAQPIAEIRSDMTTPVDEPVTPPADTTPPLGTVLINGGALSTDQANVTLSLSATDDASGVVEMRLSNDGVTFGAPMAYATNAGWTLDSGPGVKAVHAQFRDGAGNWSGAVTDTIELSAGPAVAPRLGAHVLLAQNEFAGTSPAVTSPITTQASGSTLLALSMGWLSNVSSPADSRGNVWSQISGPNPYYGDQFYTALWASPLAAGGAGHTLSFAKEHYPEGEISMALIEVRNGGRVDAIYNLAPASNQTPGTITVDGPATLIAVWGGASGALNHTATPDNGFTVIESYLDFGDGDETAVQVSIAAKEVSTAGTYTVRWSSTPSQDCACYLIAVRSGQQTPPSQGLVAAYGFNEGAGLVAGDLSGNGLDGGVSNATWAPGRFGQALQFTGMGNSVVTVADSPLLQLSGSFTLSAWVNPEAGQPSEPTVIGKEISGALPYVLYAQGPDGTGPTVYSLINSAYRNAATTQALPSETWSHLAATYDGAALSLFVNGVLAASTPVSGNVTLGSGALRIGNNSVFSGEGFIGRIDEVRVYNRAMSVSEIVTDMATPLNGTAPPDDNEPPVGTIEINDAAATAEQRGVTLTLAATDNETSVVQMRFSNDGANFGEPLPFAATAAWNLSIGDGQKTVSVQFRDEAGNWSSSFTDGIVLNSGLVAAYAFNEGSGVSTADVSGNGLTGAVSNAAWSAGRFNGSLQFNGQTNSSVIVASSPLLAFTTSFTLSAWVNPGAAQPAEPTLIAREISGGLPYVLYAQGPGGIGPNVYTLVGNDYYSAVAMSPLSADTWTHLAATYDGATLSIYVNGTLSSSRALSGTLAAGDGALRVGSNAVFPDEGFVGRIDEVRIYSRAIPASQIQADMESPLDGGIIPPPTGDTTPPVGSIQVNDGAEATGQAAVTLALSAADESGEVVEMRFSNDGVSFSAPMAFAPTAPWVLAGGNGTKTVRAQFRDVAGNWSSSSSDTILLASAPLPLPPIPTGHPRILLVGTELQRLRNDLATQRPGMIRFKEQVVDAQMSGADIYGYEPWYSALMGVVSGNPAYCGHAIQSTDEFLDEEGRLMRAGELPVGADDHYLFIGEAVGGVALVYDWCYSQLTDTQRLRWGNYADRFLENVWNQDANRWGEATPENNYSWDGTPKEPDQNWSVNNPFNNYYYSFLRGTMLWGLASKHEPNRPLAEVWLQKFRHEKVQDQLVPAFQAQLSGGGSREGTGYGTAMRDLFGVYHFWERTTGERIADLTPHARETMPYLLHAISPSRDFLAPIGDHARDSSAAFYDYHRQELMALASLYKDTPTARSVRDFLAASSRPRMGERSNWVFDVLYDAPDGAVPAALNTAYFSPGTGHFFSRSSWATDATWLTYITGPYTESHAHPDGMSLMLFKNGWLVNDANMTSSSGLAQTEEAHGLVAQHLPNGTPLGMWGLEADPTADPPRPESAARLKAMADNPLYAYASTDQGTLFNHPHEGNPGVRQEREVLHLKPGIVVVFDRIDYTAGASIKTFQLPTPGQPVVSGRTATYDNGGSTLTVHAMQPALSALSVTRMSSVSSDFVGGYRIDSRVTTSGLTHFLNVLSVDGAVVTATQGGNAGSLTLVLDDGRTVAIAFNLQGQGGTIEIRNPLNEVLVSEALPSTVAIPPVVIEPN